MIALASWKIHPLSLIQWQIEDFQDDSELLPLMILYTKTYLDNTNLLGNVFSIDLHLLTCCNENC